MKMVSPLRLKRTLENCEDLKPEASFEGVDVASKFSVSHKNTPLPTDLDTASSGYLVAPTGDCSAKGARCALRIATPAANGRQIIDNLEWNIAWVH